MTHAVKPHLRMFLLCFLCSVSVVSFSMVITFFSWISFNTLAVREREIKAGCESLQGIHILKVWLTSKRRIDHENI